MGREIPYQSFESADFYQFGEHLERETRNLARLFADGSFSAAHPVGGFELEAWLVDSSGKPVARNAEFLEHVNHPDVVPELSRFNIEINVQPQSLRTDALHQLHLRLQDHWERCQRAARDLDLELMSIGIHPGLQDSQLNLANMSPNERYWVLNEQVLAMRNSRPITLDLRGRQHLQSVHHDVMLEAATTSFQVHLQIPQDLAVRCFNAAQIVSAPLVAVSANSPYLFGADLWDESRVPLFEQAVDLGGMGERRVSLGERYLQQSLLECFEENVRRFPPLIPMDLTEDHEPLPHLSLHNGTIWRWNRPIVGFDAAGKSHLRIENRVLPSGPTILDMIANAAFFWGLTLALARSDIDFEKALPFRQVHENFYAAARIGMDSELSWFNQTRMNAAELVQNLLPLAEQGLQALELSPTDIARYLGIIENRSSRRQNGASWQRQWVQQHGADMLALSRAYLACQRTGRPVHEWPLAG